MDALVYGQVKKLQKKVDDLNAKLDATGKVIDLRYDFSLIGVGLEQIIDLTIGTRTNKMAVKNIYVKGGTDSAVEVEILSKSDKATAFSFYKNAVSSNLVYDQVDVPYIDDDNKDSLHVRVKNIGKLSTPFTLRITGISAI